MEIIITVIGLIAALIAILQFSGIANYRDLFPQNWLSTKYLPAKPVKISQKSNNPFHISKLTSIPVKKQIVGREAELQDITDAIKAKKHVVAFGGIGKTTLVRLWLDNLLAQENHGFEKVFAWSFYSQGSHDTQNSSANFFEAALIIQRGDMKLYKVDWHISMNNYQLTMHNKAEALQHKNEARKLIEETGYKLRLNMI